MKRHIVCNRTASAKSDCFFLSAFRGRMIKLTLSLQFTAVRLFVGLSCAVIATAAWSADDPPFRNTEELEDGQWLMPAKDYANTRFSGLKDITAENVKNLQVAWTFSTGVNRGQEAAPIIVGDTMYVITPYPNILYALDLNNQGAMKWKYEPKPAAAAQGVACCDVVNRGAVFSNDRLYFNTLDGNVCGVDAKTGKEVFKTLLGDINKGETITMAPIVVNNKVIVGDS